jgi:hypothetical protein
MKSRICLVFPRAIRRTRDGDCRPQWNDGNCPPSRPGSGSFLSSFAGWSRTTSCQRPYWNKRTKVKPDATPGHFRTTQSGNLHEEGLPSTNGGPQNPANHTEQSSVGGYATGIPVYLSGAKWQSGYLDLNQDYSCSQSRCHDQVRRYPVIPVSGFEPPLGVF